MTIAYLFPGQGSQSVGMGRALAEAYDAARQTFEEADELLGFPLSRLMWNGPADELNDTLNTQPALYVHSLAARRVLAHRFPRLRPAFCAGHSLGELTALTAAGALPFDAGLRLARKRGELMKRAGETSPGGMAAVLGLDIPVLEAVCAQASTADEIVQVANDNCPGQVVISGARPALERALELAKEAGARRLIPLAVSIAAHSPLMRSVQEEFNAAVNAAPIADAAAPVVGNVAARPLSLAADLRADLRAQLTSRVRWTESVRFMTGQGVTKFIELGHGGVLAALARRIDERIAAFSSAAPADFERLAEALQ